MPNDQRDEDARDAEIETGKHVREPLTVLGLLEECRTSFKQYGQQTFAGAEAAERAYSGEMENDGEGVEDFVSVHGSESAGVFRNYLRSLTLTWASRIMEDRPTVRAWPSDASYYDQAATEAANALIDHCHQRLDLDAMMERAAVLAQLHTCVGIKVTWDPDGGPREKVTVIDEELGIELEDPETGERLVEEGDPQGEVQWDLVSVFNFITDGAERIKDAKWCAFRTYLTEDDARALLLKHGAETADADRVQVEQYESIWKLNKQGVEVWELWHLPCDRIPKGLFAVIVGGQVASSQEWPEGYPGLPLAVWKVGDKTGHPHGTSHMIDALPIQRRVNDIVRTQAKMLADVGEHVRMIAPSKVVEAWESDNQLIACDDPQQAGIIRWVTPPYEALAGIHEEIAREREALFEVFGLNEYLTGQADMKASASGKAIAYLKELDSKKLAMAARNFGEAFKRAMWLTLRLHQSYAPDEQLLDMTGPDGMPQVQAFRAASLRGVDVRLEPMSGAERWRASKAGSAMEQAAQGFRDPKQAMAMQATGLESSGGEVEMRQRVQEQIEATLSGVFVQADDTIDPQIAQEEIAEALDVNATGASPQQLQALQMLRMQYAQKSQQNQQQQQPQAPQPKPGGGGPTMQPPNMPGMPGPLGGGGSFQ